MKHTSLTRSFGRVALLLATVSHLPAATILTDNFTTTTGTAVNQTYTPGVLPTGLYSSNRVWQSATDNDSTYLTRVTTDTENYFGRGTSNQYLSIVDNSNANGASGQVLSTNGYSMGTIGTVAFNFYQPATTTQGTGWIVRLGSSAGNTTTNFALYMNNGTLSVATGAGVAVGATLGTYSLDTAHALTVFFNNSASSTSYSDRTLTSGTFDVYLDGTLVGSYLTGSGGGTTGTNITNFNITHSASTTQASDFMGALYIDDFATYSGINLSAIPEPSTFTLLAGSAALALGCMRRRRKV